MRHARTATDLWVTLAQEPRQLYLEVRDNGRPAPAAPGRPGSGLGRRSMQQRAQALGGTVTAAPGPDGFAVRLVVPLKAGTGPGAPVASR